MTTFLDYARRGRTAWWRYPLCLALFAVLAVAITFLVLLPPAILHWLPADLAQEVQHPTNAVIFFAVVGVQFAALIAGLLLAALIVHRKGFGDLIGAWRWPAFAAGAGVWAVIVTGLTLIDVVLAPHGFRYTAGSGTPGFALMALLGLAPQTFAEEFIFRGYITQALLLAIKRPAPTAIVSGLIFAAFHIPNGWPQAAYALGFGIAMALVAIRTGSLAFGAGVHLLNNLFDSVVVVSDDDVFHGLTGLFSEHAHHLVWFDTLFGALALAPVVWLAYRPPAWLRPWIAAPVQEPVAEAPNRRGPGSTA